jgi:spore coat protein U-like protein
LAGTHNESSCSSGPESPHRHQNQQQLDAGNGGRGRAQYLSATCVVVTHYDGDSSNVVDEHFAKALNFGEKTNKGKFADLQRASDATIAINCNSRTSLI